MRTAWTLAFALTSLSTFAQELVRREGSINRWDEAVPLGNGLTGGLLWGDKTSLKLSLDRGDLWDLRAAPGTHDKDFNYAAMKRLVAAGNQSELDRLFDGPYNDVYPTKINAGRVEFDGLGEPRSFTLNMAQAEGVAEFDSGRVKAFFSAKTPVTMLRFEGVGATPKLLPPKSLSKLGYKLAEVKTDGKYHYFVQECAEGLVYAIVLEVRGSDVALSISAGNSAVKVLKQGMKTVDNALDKGYENLLTPHTQWWKKHWATSSVSIPDPSLQRVYDLAKYFYGSASRNGSPPMPLQGVWTADEGNLPPWKGDYHNDLNTQTTYLAYPTAGLYESGLSWIEYNWKLLPTYKNFARSFYAVDGAVIPGVMTLDGKPLGGWGMYSFSPTNGAWIAHQFYRHWKISGDSKFLKSRAYPFCNEIGTALAGLLGPDGKLPLSSSPEIHDNTLKAWLKPNSNYDGALMKWLFGALSEMSHEMGDGAGTMKWNQVLAKIPALILDPEDAGLAFSVGENYRESHRHFSHAMAVHPLGVVSNQAGYDQTVDRTLDRIIKHGTAWWTGYSFSWFSAMLARCNRPEPALKYLKDYERFTLPNGFHVNGDQTGSGISNFTYRPFTLEGNFLAMEAVQEMLIRGVEGVVTVFPAVSTSWGDVSFRDLRVEGGFKVSATRKGGETQSVELAATVRHSLLLRDPFVGRGKWNRKVSVAGGLVSVTLNAGEILVGKRS